MSLGKALSWIAAVVVVAYGAYGCQPSEPAADESKLSESEIELAAAMPKAPAGPAVRVLFVGNSMVHTGNMPGLLVGLARAGGVNLEVEHHTPIGLQLSKHVRETRLQGLLDQGGWDAVVLQEQTELSAAADERVRDEMKPAATTLARRARAASPRTRLLLYMVPAWRDGGAVGTYAGMQDRMASTYRRVGKELNATVAPAGEAWRIVRRTRPDIELYRDNGHPNRAGAYLIACVFYASLFDKNPSGSNFAPGVDPVEVPILQRAAWEAVKAEP